MRERSLYAYGNLAEYAPIILILLYLLETVPAVSVTLTGLRVLGGSFLRGRLMHSVCFGFIAFSRPLRIGGIALILLPLIGVAIPLLILVV